MLIMTVSGAALRPYIPAIARLRITVFRDWPYLYDGDVRHEETYLQTYVDSTHAGVVLALDGDTVVGASTCLPMADETANVQAPFRANGWDIDRIFYFGESILLARYRGTGIGVRFFEEREAHVRRVSTCDITTFCAVQRPADHPARPAGAMPLDAFWRKRGYTPHPELSCEMRWTDVGDTEETPHRLAFWLKSPTDIVTIAREAPGQPDMRPLLEQAWAYSDSLYPAESNHHLGVEALAKSEVWFVVARRRTVAVGCAALVTNQDGTGELKSLFVDPATRGFKIGRRLLAAIEAQAVSLGLTVIRLETGIRQPEALRLYESAGYVQRGPFGGYSPDPLSLFMEKPLV
ncbi:GNAT family N-acetyltransferase [Acidisoma cladoniae]|jgi:GNAT superfamily N-acetyltransferase|uniref:GNAT family N-acetyltransferase n=1 Tax=Acidisoma cladoniae TaxID=3040935 RepID=UPI003313C5EA